MPESRGIQGVVQFVLIPLASCAALSETWLDFLDSKIVQGAKFYGVSEFFKVLEFYKIVQSRKWFYGNLTLDEDALFLQGLAPSAPKKINLKPNSGNLLQILSERTRGPTLISTRKVVRMGFALIGICISSWIGICISLSPHLKRDSTFWSLGTHSAEISPRFKTKEYIDKVSSFVNPYYPDQALFL